MKTALAGLVVAVILLFSGAPSSAQITDELVILYTGDTLGHVDPCG